MTPCELCGGACCKSFVLPEKIFTSDIARWLGYHGSDEGNGFKRFDCACNMLKDGKCSIYADRPQVCKNYAVGSRECREAIKRFSHEKYEDVVSLIKQQTLGGAK